MEQENNMTDRDRLTELLKADLEYFSNDIRYWHDEHIGALADYLLSNGVIVGVVRCKACALRDESIHNNTVWCNYHDTTMRENGFCSEGYKEAGE